MSPAEIDTILAEFRAWLESHHAAPEPVEALDTKAIVAQFTALRHEVNMQTKASRALTEQAGKLLENAGAEPGLPKPVLKAFLDLADVLAVSAKQMAKFRETMEPLFEQLAVEPLPETPQNAKPGFLARLGGATNDALWSRWSKQVQEQHTARTEAAASAAETVLDLARAAEDGYAMSLRRVERALPDLGLEPIDTVGEAFDPETMEVIEVSGDGTPGVVAEELRRGFRSNGQIIRFAQVRVPR